MNKNIATWTDRCTDGKHNYASFSEARDDEIADLRAYIAELEARTPAAPVVAEGLTIHDPISDWECGFITADTALREIEKRFDAAHPVAGSPAEARCPTCNPVRCVVCNETEARTGTCGSTDPRALCNLVAAAPMPASEAPEGFKWVPLEPTEEMVRATASCLNDEQCDCRWQVYSEDGSIKCQPCADQAAEQYRMALAAAPVPASEAASVEIELRQQRLVAPNGHQGPWVECGWETYDKFAANPDVGDGFKYEVRELCIYQPRFAAPAAPTDAKAELLAIANACVAQGCTLPMEDWLDEQPATTAQSVRDALEQAAKDGENIRFAFPASPTERAFNTGVESAVKQVRALIQSPQDGGSND